jgi:group I intron endonuclease
MSSGIYRIVNQLHNGSYIGSSKNIEDRFRTHLNQLRNYEHPNLYLQVDYFLYSASFFRLEVLFEIETTKENLLALEAKFIQQYPNCYNAIKDTIHNKHTKKWEGRRKFT